MKKGRERREGGGGRKREEEGGGGRRRKEEGGGGGRRKEEGGGGRRRKKEGGGGRRRKEEEGGGRRGKELEEALQTVTHDLQVLTLSARRPTPLTRLHSSQTHNTQSRQACYWSESSAAG